MKVSVTVRGSLVDRPRARTGHVEALSRGVVRRLTSDLQEELQRVLASERAADPDARRDALERAVRRIWGATL